MIGNIILPRDLDTFIGSESKDFVVKADRAMPLKKSFSFILFGIVWVVLTIIFVFIFLVPVFQGKEVHFESNEVPTVAGPGNLGPIVMPTILIVVFGLVGIGILTWGIYLIFKKGGYFVGTPTRLAHYQNKNIRSMDWEQFSGDIEISGNAQKGTIALQMRTGKMISRKNGPDRYVPDVIYMSGISNVFEIEQICRRRIKENDPTPSAIVDNKN